MDEKKIEPLLVSKRTARGALEVCPRTIDYLIASGMIESRRVGRRRLIVYHLLQEFAKRDHPEPLAGVRNE